LHLLDNIPFTIWLVFWSFLAHQFLQKILLFEIPFLDAYFDPFACAVLGLSALKMERKYLWKAKNIKLKWYEILVATICLALISEVLFPYLSERFTSDPYDYTAFGMGAIYFSAFGNQT